MTAGLGPDAGKVGVLSVNVAKPAYLGMHRGRAVTSGIAKRPVAAAELWLDRENLEGDGQAELGIHGGFDKAVYAYPSEHLAAWGEELGEELGPAAFGENLTTEGWTEDDVRVGDRWYWGDAVLEVTQPRWPCYKLAMYRGRPDIGRRMRRNGRTGWYLRVLEPGRVPTSGAIRVERNPVPASIRLLHEAASPGHDVPTDVIEALISLGPVADEWRMALAARL
ncbi:MAG TPA: MOSC domain-containing protein [Acidimicrobiales bacterium]|nr:MOSC domain-containing protein [Acidimicrobiales bacterium]